jgi:hypothetical protein
MRNRVNLRGEEGVAIIWLLLGIVIGIFLVFWVVFRIIF